MQTYGVSQPRPRLDVMKALIDGLILPTRHPILFVPFLLFFAVTVLAVGGFLAAFLADLFHGGEHVMRHLVNLFTALVIIFVAFFLASAVTTELTARIELGRNTDLAEAAGHVIRRLLPTLGAGLLLALIVGAGFALFVIPGVWLMVRLILAREAVLLSETGATASLGESWRLTDGQFWPFLGLLLLLGAGAAVLITVLGWIPVVGQLASFWLSVAWGTIALTLAYVRMGGPAQLE